MSNWNVVLEVTSNEMIEHVVDVARNPVLSVTAFDRKRSLSAGADEKNDSAKRHNSDVYSTLSLPVGHVDTGYPSPRSSYGGVHASSYPISSLYNSPSQNDDEAGYNRSYSSQSQSSSADLTSHRTSSYRQVANSNDGYERSTRANTTERFGFPNFRSSFVTELGYPGQYDFHGYPYGQEDDAGRRNDEGYPPMPSDVPRLTKRNRFNLSRYQLDDDEDLLATIADESDVIDDVKPNRSDTQRERLMQSQTQDSENSDSTAPGFVDKVPLLEGEGSSSRDSFISQRERLMQFRNEHSYHVVIPSQWEGEKNLHDFVAFGNIEAALRPLGLMMARAALVNDSVTTRHHRSSSSGSSAGCHSNSSNPLHAQS